MGHNKSIKELREMTEDRQHEYLSESNVFTEEEWELYKESKPDSYKSYELVNTDFHSEDGREYLISVEHWHDGERPDGRNTRINIIKLD